MSKSLIIIFIFTASFLTLVLIAGWFFTTSPGEEVIRKWLEGSLSATTGIPIQIESLETNLWSRIRLNAIAAWPATRSDSPPVLYIDRVILRYSLLSLLSDTTTLQALEIDSVFVDLAADSLGLFDVPMIDEPILSDEVSDRSVATIAFNSISVGPVRLKYLDEQLQLNIDLSEAAIAVQGNGDGSYTGRVTAAGITSTYQDIKIAAHNLYLAGSIKDETIHVAKAGAELEGLQINFSGDIGYSTPHTLSLDVIAEGNPNPIMSALPAYGIPDLYGAYVKLHCEIEGDATNPQLALDGQFRHMDVSGLLIDSALIRARYSDHRVELDEFQLSSLGGSIAGNGQIGLDSDGITKCNISTDKLSISDVWKYVYSEISPYQGDINGTITAEGIGANWTKWGLDASFETQALRYVSVKLPDLTCRVTLDSGISNVSLVHGNDVISANLRLSTDRLNGDFNLTIPNVSALARFFNHPEFSGSFVGSGSVGGLYTNPNLKFTGSGSYLSYRGFPVDTMSVKLTYADSQLIIEDFTSSGRLDSIGSGNPLFDLESISGAMSYECRLMGPIGNLQGNMKAMLAEPKYNHYALDSLAIEVSLDGHNVAVKRLDVGWGDILADLKAEYDMESGAGSFALVAEPVLKSINDKDSTDITALIKPDLFGSITGQFTLDSSAFTTASVLGNDIWLGLVSQMTSDSTLLDGYASFDLRMQGPIFSPDASIYINIKPLLLSNYTMDSLTTYIHLDQSALFLDSLFSYALEHTLLASGQIELAVNKDGYLEIATDAQLLAKLEARDFDLAALQGIALPDGDLEGTVTAQLNASGEISSPVLNGWFNVHDGRVKLEQDSPPIEDLQVSLGLHDSTLTIDSVTGTVTGTPLKLQGTISVSQFESAFVDLAMKVGHFGKLNVTGVVSDDHIDLRVLSDTLNLAVFESFLPAFDSLNGRLFSSLSLHRTSEAMEIDGSLRINSMAFQAPKYYVNVNNGFLDTRFNQNSIWLDSASANINRGDVSMSGVVIHDNGILSDITFTAVARHVQLNEPGAYFVTVDSASLSYGKQNDVYVLGGDVIIGEARFTKGQSAASVLPWVE